LKAKAFVPYDSDQHGRRKRVVFGGGSPMFAHGRLATSAFYVLAALGGLNFVTNAFPSQSAHAKKSGSAKKSASSARDTAAANESTATFDSSASALPANFAGNSFMPLYRQAVVISPKGEFETTAEFERRSHTVPAGTYAFVMSPTASDIGQPKYDADAEVMSVEILPMTFAAGSPRKDVTGFPVSSANETKSKYVGTNAFGASVLIEKSSRDYRIVSLPGIGPFSTALTLSFPLPRAAAPSVKPRLRVLLIGAIAMNQEPPIPKMDGANGFEFKEATFDSPYEWTDRNFILTTDLSDVWVFDRATGHVYAKYSEIPHHGEMKLSVSNGRDEYARVSVEGNNDLALMRRSASNFAPPCAIVTAIHDLVGYGPRGWQSGESASVTGEFEVIVTDQTGAVLFDEHSTPSPGSYGMAPLIRQDRVSNAAEAMWNAAPRGKVEIRGGNSRFETNVPLAGFRELWSWGVANCGFPPLAK
jgi:hypothetical protein